ncbi:MAG: lamin tail domain-containing protein, partial [Verrucomicrobiales bacterium]|nr:lamin tail domain-containing protein [Verrucomicrobiales bacterium]
MSIPTLISLPCVLGSFLFVSSASGQEGVGITEFLADNKRGLVDEDGEASDWIEIRNGGAGVADLAGYSLTDDPAVLQKWVFAAEDVAPGGTLIVFASGKDRATGGGELHTNFGLDSGGGYLALVAPDGVTVMTEFVDYPKQREDVAYGFGGGVSEEKVLADGAPWRWTSPFTTVPDWKSRAFDARARGWRLGNSGIGYEASFGYDPFIGEGGDTTSFMLDRRPSVYMRTPFTITSATDVVKMTLRMRYDDGFAAYI